MNEEFNPQPHEWYAATIYYTNIGEWAFAKLNDGTEIFIPAQVRSAIASHSLAVRLEWKKPRQRPEAVEAISLEKYFELLGETPEENLDGNEQQH